MTFAIFPIVLQVEVDLLYLLCLSTEMLSLGSDEIKLLTRILSQSCNSNNSDIILLAFPCRRKVKLHNYQVGYKGVIFVVVHGCSEEM